MKKEVANESFIKLFRKFLEWEWYDSTNERSVFLHILIKANWKDKSYRGVEVNRGQVMISFRDLSRELGLSLQNVKTAVKNLIKTNELTHYTEGGKSIFTLVSYDKYQCTNTPTNTPTNTELTQSQHTPNTELTQSQHTPNTNIQKKDKNSKEEEEGKKIDSEIKISESQENSNSTDLVKAEKKEKEKKPSQKKEKARPSSIEQIELYFSATMSTRKNKFDARDEAEKFWNFYKSKGWKVGKVAMQDWHAAAGGWAGRVKNFTNKSTSARQVIDSNDWDVDWQRRANEAIQNLS